MRSLLFVALILAAAFGAGEAVRLSSRSKASTPAPTVRCDLC